LKLPLETPLADIDRFPAIGGRGYRCRPFGGVAIPSRDSTSAASFGFPILRDSGNGKQPVF
jgi:hypothetical protein